jgi:phosphatidylserine decarboxylase
MLARTSLLGECIDWAAALFIPRRSRFRQTIRRRVLKLNFRPRCWATRIASIFLLQFEHPTTSKTSYAVSPADARVLVGSLQAEHLLFLKNKFFHYEELVGTHLPWVKSFREGDFAIFRLTPDKYHYNHTPVSGVVLDFYELAGEYHSLQTQQQLSNLSRHTPRIDASSRSFRRMSSMEASWASSR